MKTFDVSTSEHYHAVYRITASRPYWAERKLWAMIADAQLPEPVHETFSEIDVTGAEEIAEPHCNHDAPYLKSGETCECGEIKP